MPNPTTLLELADRVERATGADRELDVDICAAANPDLAVYHGYSVADLRAASPANTNAAFAKITGVPAYTSSTDDALMLVPDGAIWQGGGGNGRAYAIVVSEQDVDPIRAARQMTFEAATPALAICAASLRARAAGGEG